MTFGDSLSELNLTPLKIPHDFLYRVSLSLIALYLLESSLHPCLSDVRLEEASLSFDLAGFPALINWTENFRHRNNDYLFRVSSLDKGCHLPFYI